MKYTKEEKEFIIANYGILSYAEIANVLGREASQIKGVVARIGIVRIPQGTSKFSRPVAANAQAVDIDKRNCTNCTNCTDCTDCTNCTNCTDCRNCTNCTDCRNCTYCTDCRNCTNCTNCTYCAYCRNCTVCTDCTDCTGILKWRGKPAKSLLGFNGLTWPVSMSIGEMQIGCQLHSVKEWESFTSPQIDTMDPSALTFWLKWKTILLDMHKARYL